MTQLVIPAAGAVGGFLIGGPTGASIGWAAGSYYVSSKQSTEQATVQDLRIQTASYGTNIPIVISRQRVSGNVIWASEKKPYEVKTRAGKGGPTTSSTGYRISALISICAGPILGVSKVWSDGKLIIDSSTEVKPLIGELYLGSMSQTADPTYQAAVGAADAPAYRGLAYISLTDFDLGVQGRIPNFSFEVVKGASI